MQKSDEARKKQNAACRSRVARLKSEKRCVQCGEQDSETMNGKRLCSSCAQIHSSRVVEYQSLRHMRGLCTECGKPVEQYGAWRCNEHIEKAKKRREKKKKEENNGKGD